MSVKILEVSNKLTLPSPFLLSSSSKPMGSLLRRSSTEYGFATCLPRAVLKWSSAVWEMTRVLPGKVRSSSKICNPALTEPSTVSLDPSWLSFGLALLKRSGLDDLAVFVAHSLATVQHLDLGGRFRITVEIFT
jgi:hypothetical protein